MNQNPDTDFYIPDEEMKVPEQMEYQSDGESKGSHLVVILIIAIVVVLVALGGLYLWDQSLQTDEEATVTTPSRPTASENQEPESANARAEVETMNALSPSDQLPAIITDLENTDLDNLNAELQTIDQELQ